MKLCNNKKIILQTGVHNHRPILTLATLYCERKLTFLQYLLVILLLGPQGHHQWANADQENIIVSMAFVSSHTRRRNFFFLLCRIPTLSSWASNTNRTTNCNNAIIAKLRVELIKVPLRSGWSIGSCRGAMQ